MSLFGWNLLYNSVENDIRSNEDILVCLTHLVLVSNGFQCIGVGDSKNLDGNEPKTETLPKGWNDNYKLRYVYQGRLYNLQGTRLDDGVMLNLIRVDERNVSTLQLNSRIVLKRSGSIDDMIPSHEKIVKMIKDELMDKAAQSTKSKETSSQTNPHPMQQTGSDLRDYRMPSGYSNPYHNPPPGVGVGRQDLDPLAGIGGPRFGGIPAGGYGPLGGGGGGMLFQPPSRMDPARPGIPGGSVPPGARFDPFRPPDVDRFPPRRGRNPDNDEMPPPGFDDMYM